MSVPPAPLSATVSTGYCPHNCARLCDEGGIRTAYRDHARDLLTYCTAILRDRRMAEDVVQEAFVRGWRNCSSFRASTNRSVRSWLFVIARHAAIDAIRARNRRPPVADGSAWEAETGTAEMASSVVDHVYFRDELNRLSEEHRRVVEAAFYQDLSRSDIAQRDGLPIGTVKSRLYYALRELRQSMAALEQAV